jgi:hypothetical protein
MEKQYEEADHPAGRVWTEKIGCGNWVGRRAFGLEDDGGMIEASKQDGRTELEQLKVHSSGIAQGSVSNSS